MSSANAEPGAVRHPFVPLSQRPISALRARAVELRQMAQSATTALTRTSLLTLAERFDDLADRRLQDMAPADDADTPVCDYLQPAQPV